MRYVALIPSNQDRNRYLDGSHSEYQVLHQLASAAESRASEVSDLTAKAIAGSPESSDGWRLQGLYQQMTDAANWLHSVGATPANGIMVNLHSDSGSYRHIFGIYGGGQDSASFQLAKKVAARVEELMQTNDLRYLDYSDYVFYQKRGPYNCCLVELGSHQNAGDVGYLLTRQADLGAAIVQGAVDFLGGAAAPARPPSVPGLAEAIAYFEIRGVTANPDSAIFKYWRAAYDLGDLANLGPAMADEEPGEGYDEPNAVVQKFTNGVVVSKRDEGWKCYRGQVVLEPERWLGLGG